jgi:hypothetical protein
MTEEQNLPPDEDNSVLEAVEGEPGLEPAPDPGLFTDDQEQTDPEDAA